MTASTGGKVISGYGDGGFRFGDARHAGSLIVLPERVVGWAVSGMADVTPASLDAVVGASPRIDVLLLGCGTTAAPVGRDVLELMRRHGIVVDAMTTGAACRTYNILLAEARLVAAALIAV